MHIQDLRRFPTPILKISFDGPDIPEEELWNIFRVRRVCYISTEFWGSMSNAAVWENSRGITAREWTSRHPQVLERVIPEYAISDGRQKRHAQLCIHYRWEDYHAENGVCTTDTSPRGEGLDYGTPEDCAADCGLLVGELDICGKGEYIIYLFVVSQTTRTDLRPYSRLDGASEDTQLVRSPGVQPLQVAEGEYPIAFVWYLRHAEALQCRRSLER